VGGGLKKQFAEKVRQQERANSPTWWNFFKELKAKTIGGGECSHRVGNVVFGNGQSHDGEGLLRYHN